MLELADIYHPTIAYYYTLHLLISFVLTTIIIIPAIYIILTQSKNAKIFKYLLINQMFWSYLFCIVWFVEGNVPLSPIPAAYCAGIIKNFSVDAIAYHFPINLLVGIGWAQAYTFSSLYRVTYASAFNKLQTWFEDAKKLTALMAGTLVITSMVIVGPFIVTKYDGTYLLQELITEYPVLQELLKHESYVFAAPDIKLSINSTSQIVALKANQIYTLLMFIIFLVVYIIFLRQVLTSKNSVSELTHKKYKTLLIAKTIQLCSLTIFLAFPFLIGHIILYSKTKNGSLIGFIFVFFPSFHLFLEVLALLYFIKPYREYCANRFGFIYFAFKKYFNYFKSCLF